MTTSTPPPFKKERQQTDDSLTVERGKTDESFETYKGNAESEANRAVSENRLEADLARSQRRSDADFRREGTNSDLLDQKDLAADDKYVLKERKSEDSAVEKERFINDLAIAHERGEKERLINRLVSLERETTDKNLLGERTKADLDAKAAANLLTVEQAAHLSTKSALTTREEFLAIVSHDLRNPIGAILASAELLLEEPMMAGPGSESKKWLEMIKRNAKTSLRLISDLLDMERIVEGKLNLQLAPHKIGHLAKEVIESHVHLAAAKNITLQGFSTATAGSIPCDKDRVIQILSNLIGNAVKFTPEGGTIDVTTTEGEFDISISVRDSGPGIPSGQQERIFERFAQIGNKNRSGLGLGLYISRTLAKSHNGELSVRSTDGKGSTFCLTLPKT